MCIFCIDHISCISSNLLICDPIHFIDYPDDAVERRNVVQFPEIKSTSLNSSIFNTSTYILYIYRIYIGYIYVLLSRKSDFINIVLRSC